jgi:transcription initiation factor TFIID subunit 9B
MYEIYKTEPQELPQTARLIALILQGANVEDFEPRVLAQIYEVAHTYIVNILQDAQILAEHAGHKDLSIPDIRLAIETRTSIEFANPPSKKVFKINQTLMKLATKKNNIPLPLVPEKFGLRLPPERHCLIKQNISIVPKKRSGDYDMGSVQSNLSLNVPGLPKPLPVPFYPKLEVKQNAIPDEDDYDMDD